jgi:membrane protease YdiL (CAAX protease family)
MLEELAFRAILLRLFPRASGPLPGLVLSSLLFGLAHLSHRAWTNAAEIAFNVGLLMGLLYMTIGHLWISMALMDPCLRP